VWKGGPEPKPFVPVPKPHGAENAAPAIAPSFSSSATIPQIEFESGKLEVMNAA